MIFVVYPGKNEIFHPVAHNQVAVSLFAKPEFGRGLELLV